MIPILRQFRIKKMQPASSFTFCLVQLYSTCNWGNWQNKQLTIIKPTQIGINQNKETFLHYKIIRALLNIQKPATKIVILYFSAL
jgi:hypothetical protein